MAEPKPAVLIIDDEENIRSSLRKILIREGYQVVTIESGEAAVSCLLVQAFDLVLIDLKLPGIGGIEVLELLQQQFPETVAIILTAHGSLETAIQALRHGAHDYLLKPCNPLDLLNSVRNGLLERQQRQELLSEMDNLTSNLNQIRATLAGQLGQSPVAESQLSQEYSKRFLQQGSVMIDFLQHIIKVDGESLPLTATEFDLLAYLVRHANKVVSAQELVRAVHGYDAQSSEATVTIRSHIYHIRKKIKQVTGRTNIIRTLRGIGYTIGPG